jgi:cysteinyl-tRNA synthetase
MEKLEEAQKSLDRIQTFFQELSSYHGTPQKDMDGNSSHDQEELWNKFLNDFLDAMDTDFNTAKALGYFFSFVKEFGTIFHTNQPLGKELQDKMVEEFTKIDQFFNFILPATQNLNESGEKWKNRFENVVNSLLEYRKRMKQEKRYDLADQIRDLLDEQGIKVKDDGNEYSWEIA